MNEMVSIFIFWVLIVTADGGSVGADVYHYPNPVLCEAARQGTADLNTNLPGFHIAPECIQIPVSPTGEGLPTKADR